MKLSERIIAWATVHGIGSDDVPDLIKAVRALEQELEMYKTRLSAAEADVVRWKTIANRQLW